MPRRGENIFKRKDGRWEARYIHHYEDGKAKYRYIYGDSYMEVKAKRLAEQSLPESQIISTSKQTITVGQVANAWLCDIKISVKESTYTRYYRTVTKYILPTLGNMYINKVDSLAVNRFTEDLLSSGGLSKKALSAKTVTDILSIVKSIYKFGKINGYSCPDLDGVRYPQKSGKTIKILSEDNRLTLEKLLLSSTDNASIGILFSLFTGVRIGELCGLRWGDIDFADSTVKIRRTVERISDLDPLSKNKTKVIISEPKTENSVRTIPIPAFLTEHLSKHRKSDNIYIITGNTTFSEPHAFYIRYKKYLRESQLEDYTFHALRHTFATRCIEAGFDTKSLSEILGHSNVTTTMMFYVHPSIEQKRVQMERLTPIGLS